MTDAPNARPMHSQGLLLIAVAVGVLMLAVYLTSSIMENENGGISAAVRTIGVGLAIWSLIRPKAGLYIISIEAFSLDYVKKVAVYYGTVSTGTIIEVLVVGMLAVVATISGVLIQGVALRRFKLTPLQWGVTVVAALASLASVLATYKQMGLEKSVENAFNGTFYIALALPITVLFPDREQLRKLFNLQFFLATVWAIAGIKQYYFDFSPLEWFYAETGLSAVATGHMITAGDTRPFGFGTGGANYTVIAAYCCYGMWHTWHSRQRRLLFGLCTLIIAWGLVTSLQRTLLATPVFVLIFYYCLRTTRRTIIATVACATVFITGVIFSEDIYNHLPDINNAISIKGGWAESVLTVGTYSERLESWMQLKQASTYTLFGMKDPIPTHDGFTNLIVHYGVAGFLITLIVVAYGGSFVQRTISRVQDDQDRLFATFCLSITTAYLALGAVGGDNFTANPVNLALWGFFGAALSMAINSRLAEAPVRSSMRDIMQRLEAIQPKVPMAARAALAHQKVSP